MPTDPLFTPLELPGGVRLRNRIVMAPMTTYSANADGTISEAELASYRARAAGVGMVVTGCTPVTADGVGFIEEFACYDDSFLPSLTALAEAAKSGGNPAVLQIFHAGNKALPQRTPGGKVVSASAHPAPSSQQGPGGTPVKALTEEEILTIIRAFGEATRRAIRAGFDGVELHGAHGFLLQNFLSPAINKRTDSWGGSRENRARFARVVARECRKVAQEDAVRPFIIGYRISLEEAQLPDGLRVEDTLALVEALITDGSVDYLHASLKDALNDTPVGAPETTLLTHLHGAVHGRAAVLAAGGFRTPDQAREGLEQGLDAVVIGRALITEPHWGELAEAGRDGEIRAELAVDASAEDLRIPHGLHHMIRVWPGWFPMPPQTSSGSSL